MIVVTIIRVSGLHHRKADAVDLVWGIYWQWVEACIAITMVSLTAFRSFFIQHSSRNQSPLKQPWYAGFKAVMINHKPSGQKANTRQWPQIPRGTLTGVKTFIDGRRATDEEADIWPLQEQPVSQRIMVEHSLSTVSVRHKPT